MTKHKTGLRAGKWRVLEASTGRIAKDKSGKARDGGGHNHPAKAGRQVAALNRRGKK